MFKDEIINSRTFSILFFLKALAVPAFYLVYKKMYGGLERFDAGKFYTDAATINSYAYSEPIGYLKLFFGFQNEIPGTNLYDNFLAHTTQWDNGRLKEYLYNDNRVVIRVHSFLHFFTFNSYHVHALFSCFLSFIGITYLYKAIKDLFAGKELFVLIILCFLPALWFYTGALLKEALLIFILGSALYLFKQYFLRKRKWWFLILIPFLFFISLLLKPYILVFAFCVFALFFRLYYSKKIQLKTVAFLSILILLIISINLISITLTHKSLLSAALKQQRMFADASKGGIFLLDDVKFVRLDFDTSLVKKVNNNDSLFTIKKNASYIYWEHTHQEDTLFSKKNTDTITHYKLVYQLPKSGSNINFDANSKNVLVVGASCLYYSMFYPFFFNSKSLLQHLASFENLLILLSLIVIVLGFIKNKKDNFPVIMFSVFALLLCLLIGLTTPNSGAIFRYRSPAVIFILLAALYYLPVSKNTVKSTPN